MLGASRRRRITGVVCLCFLLLLILFHGEGDGAADEGVYRLSPGSGMFFDDFFLTGRDPYSQIIELLMILFAGAKLCLCLCHNGNLPMLVVCPHIVAQILRHSFIQYSELICVRTHDNI